MTTPEKHQTDWLAERLNDNPFDFMLYLALADSFEEEGAKDCFVEVFRRLYQLKKCPAEITTDGGIFIGYSWEASFESTKNRPSAIPPSVFDMLGRNMKIGHGRKTDLFPGAILFPARDGAIITLASSVVKLWQGIFQMHIPVEWRYNP